MSVLAGGGNRPGEGRGHTGGGGDGEGSPELRAVRLEEGGEADAGSGGAGERPGPARRPARRDESGRGGVLLPLPGVAGGGNGEHRRRHGGGGGGEGVAPVRRHGAEVAGHGGGARRPLEILPGREDGGQGAGAAAVEQRALGAGGGHGELELVLDALPGHRAQGGGVPGQRSRRAGGEGKLGVGGQQADGAEDAEGVVGEVALGHHPDASRREVVEAADEVEEGAAGQPPEHGVDGEVAAHDVVGEGAGEAGDVDQVPGSGDPPGRERWPSQGKRPPAGAPCDGPRGALRVAVDDEVQIVYAPPQEPVAQGASGEEDTASGTGGGDLPEHPRGEEEAGRFVDRHGRGHRASGSACWPAMPERPSPGLTVPPRRAPGVREGRAASVIPSAPSRDATGV